MKRENMLDDFLLSFFSTVCSNYSRMNLNHTILCVDSEPSAQASFRKILNQAPYLLLATSSTADARLLIEANPIHIALIDVSIDGGTQFLRDLRESHPDMVRVVVSRADNIDDMLEAVVHGEAHRFLIKPWKEHDLLATIRQCAEYLNLLQENKDMTFHIRSQNEELCRLNEQLEDEISRRTRSLTLSQKLLDNLPVALIGVSREGLIVSVNNAIAKHSNFFQEPTIGSNMRDCLPEPVIAAALRTMATGEKECFRIYNGRLRVWSAPVFDGEDVTGCVMILEEM